jgi:hypothetical protein
MTRQAALSTPPTGGLEGTAIGHLSQPSVVGATSTFSSRGLSWGKPGNSSVAAYPNPLAGLRCPAGALRRSPFAPLVAESTGACVQSRLSCAILARRLSCARREVAAALKLGAWGEASAANREARRCRCVSRRLCASHAQQHANPLRLRPRLRWRPSERLRLRGLAARSSGFMGAANLSCRNRTG